MSSQVLPPGLAQPLFRLPTAAPIVTIRQDNYRTKTFTLDAHVNAQPGQFMMAWLPRFDEKPFSLVSASPVTFMITAVGPFSTLVHELQIGDRLWIRGPFGNGFRVPPEQKRIVLVGGGYGVAPLFWLAQSQRGKAEHITLIVGARTAKDLLYVPQFEQLATAPAESTRYELIVTTEDGSAGAQGLVTHPLTDLMAAGQVDGLYACGPHGMLAALQSLGQQHEVPCQLSWEAYMRCALGICGACEHEGTVLCMDGPVLRG